MTHPVKIIIERQTKRQILITFLWKQRMRIMMMNYLIMKSVSPKNTIKKRSQARIIRSVWFNKEAQPEKNYHELIMLFTPWHNEQTDLMGSFSSKNITYLLQ